MSVIQRELWPDAVETNPLKVAEIYNKSTTTYKQQVLQDGWDSSFSILNAQLDHLVPTYVKKMPKQSGVQRIRILDAGCADGILTEKVDFEKHGADVHGFDIAEDLLKIAQCKNKYEDLRPASFAETLPYSADSFDFIIANGVLGYCATNRPLYEFVRILKAGGYILITMRSQHFQERDYPDALNELSAQCKVLTQQVFSAFPLNPEFTHEYRFILIQKL